MKVTDFIKKNNNTEFEFYRNNHLYYSVTDVNTGLKYIYPINVEKDTDQATFLKVDKAIIFMRFIRKAIENNLIQIFK